MPHPAVATLRAKAHTGIIESGYIKLNTHKTIIVSEAWQSI